MPQTNACELEGKEMTTQKSPEEIINECLLMDPSQFFTLRDEMDSRKYSSWIASIKEKLISAIKAERENIQHTYKQQNIRMTNNRLVLPPRRVIGMGTDVDVYNGGFNACLDLIEKGKNTMSKTRSDIIDLIFDKECKRRKIKTDGDYYHEVRDFFHAGWHACEERAEEESYLEGDTKEKS